MKRLLASAMALGLLLMPLMAYSQSEQTATTPPPVAPTLVREGDFAMELVGALNIGTAKNEAEAETMLVTAGIAPRNGWISDYPVTPDIIAELQNAVSEAADANRLPMRKESALEALQNVETSFGIAVVPDTSGNYAENQPPAAPQYTEPTVVNNYYYDEGPPVVTYYPPPWDYYYLYAWVPSPFWCGGFFFPGFFVLNDFDIIVVADHNHHHHHHEREVISNHIFDPKTKTVGRIDPVTRVEKAFNAESGSHGGFTTEDGRRGAAAISERSMERARMSSAGSSTMSERRAERNPISPRTERQFQIPPDRNSSTPGSSGGREFTSPRMNGRSSSAPAPSREFNPGSVSSPGRGGSFGESHGGGSFGGFRSGTSPGMIHGGVPSERFQGGGVGRPG
jgi:hypothetical protein